METHGKVKTDEIKEKRKTIKTLFQCGGKMNKENN